MSDLVESIVAFLREIGFDVLERPIEHPTFLPGISIEERRLAVDRAKLIWPGDLLHEAGHIAVTPAVERWNPSDEGEGMEREIAAMAWSWAALSRLDLDPAIVFHDGGYRGRGAALRDTFAAGVYPGLATLVSYGMTRTDLYPRMERWLRE